PVGASREARPSESGRRTRRPLAVFSSKVPLAALYGPGTVTLAPPEVHVDRRRPRAGLEATEAVVRVVGAAGRRAAWRACARAARPRPAERPPAPARPSDQRGPGPMESARPWTDGFGDAHQRVADGSEMARPEPRRLGVEGLEVDRTVRESLGRVVTERGVEDRGGSASLSPRRPDVGARDEDAGLGRGHARAAELAVEAEEAERSGSVLREPGRVAR